MKVLITVLVCVESVVVGWSISLGYAIGHHIYFHQSLFGLFLATDFMIAANVCLMREFYHAWKA